VKGERVSHLLLTGADFFALLQIRIQCIFKSNNAHLSSDMTSPFTDVAIQSLVDRFVRHQELEIAAREGEDTRAGNQQVRHIVAALDALETSAAGRAALERLMRHDLPEARLRAASCVMRWSPTRRSRSSASLPPIGGRRIRARAMSA
jgi:hypothetical protein